MSLQSDKLELIQWLIELNDQAVLEKIKWLKDNPGEASARWKDLEIPEKESILRGLKDAENNRLTAHEHVSKKYEQWL